MFFWGVIFDISLVVVLNNVLVPFTKYSKIKYAKIKYSLRGCTLALATLAVSYSFLKCMRGYVSCGHSQGGPWGTTDCVA